MLSLPGGRSKEPWHWTPMSFLESNSLHSGGARVACKKPRDAASARVLSVKLRKDRGPADASKLMGSNWERAAGIRSRCHRWVAGNY